MADASSRPIGSPRTIDSGKALLIVELRKRRMLQARIARSVGVSESTVSCVLARAGMSKSSDLGPVEAVVRYEHKAPGDLLHIDTRKLGRIVRPSPRVAGNRRDSVDGAGWETLFVPSMTTQDGRSTPCILTRSRHRQFLRNAVAYYARLGITVRRLLTDNGSAFRSREFRARPSVKQAATPRRTRLARGMHLNRAWCGRPAFRRPSAEDLEATSCVAPWSSTATRLRAACIPLRG
ncbi:hypothetical protein SAMN05444746_112166 [Variovorax sp. OK212]|nr:hypothetical protein SAMN05518853_11216 [Variovorax sp. OK202]SFD88142.1 hypothetical protein SAMN05444746_112166 [Variovorax sp. OK212]